MKWVTRSHVHVDRVACPWLITRFIERQFAVYDALYAWCRLDTARRT
jgi:hypothetical protein